MGSATDAREHSNTHRLKPPPSAMGETQFDRVYKDLMTFLDGPAGSACGGGDQEESIAVFVHDDHIKTIQSILSQLAEHVENAADLRRDITVLSMNSLFNELKNVGKAEDDRYSIAVTNMVIDRDPYDWTEGIVCDFHDNNNATLHCALGICHRWFFAFRDCAASLELMEPIKTEEEDESK